MAKIIRKYSGYFLEFKGVLTQSEINVTVYDIMGREVKDYKFVPNNSIRLDGLESLKGCYFVLITNYNFVIPVIIE